MKKTLILIISICTVFLGNNFAQTFSDSPGTTLPELVMDCSTTMTVSGIGIIDDVTLGLETVCIDITHEYTGDLESISLVAPDGTTIELTSNNGGSGDDYSVTCFDHYAVTNIVDGTNPYNGTFEPEGNLSTFNTSGINADGIWQLCIYDDYSGDGAPIVNYWSITFGSSPASMPSCFDGIMNQGEIGIDCGGPCPACNYNIDLGNDTSMCTGGSILLDAGPSFMSYLWNDGTTNQTLTATTSGTYIVEGWYRGDNVVVNGDFESGDTGFTTQYTVGAGGAWGPVSNEGTYLITDNSNTAHTNFPYCSDHTADPADQMMVINGAGTANQNVWCQTISVTPDRDYEFSTWIQNYDYANPAALAFYINGVQLGSTIAPTTYGCDWQNFFEMWNSGSATTVDICIVNENTSGSGNDFALDDISFNEIEITSDTIEISIIDITTEAIETNVACNGDSSGIAQVNLLTTGEADYTYAWSNSVTNGPIPDTTNQITNLAIGTYDVTITDALGCQAIQAFTIGDSPALTIDLTPTAAACGSNGSIDVDVNNGTAPYTITWSPGSTANNQTLPYTIANLTPQTYYITVTDSLGCTITDSSTVLDLGNIVAVIDPVGNQCLENNSFTFNASNSTSTASSSYSWNFGDATTGTGISPTHTYTSAGSYTIKLNLTDGTCSDSTTIDIDVHPSPSVSIVASHVSCNGLSDGSVSIALNGGIPPLQNIAWSPNGFTGNGTENYSDLSAGHYTVIFEDANGCPGSSAATVNQPGAIVLETNSTDAGCNSTCDGTATANVSSGGTGPYTYDWGAGTNPSNSPYTEELCGLSNTGNPISYTVTVTDNNSCVETGQVTISAATSLTLAINTSEPTCFGYADGTASVLATGGNSPYSYVWSNGNNDQNLINLTADNYSVSVTDASGCEKILSNIVISQPSQPVIALEYEPLICKGQSTEISMSVTSSPFSPYTYYWNGVQSADALTISPMENTTYNAQVIDANGCEGPIQELEIQINPDLTIDAQPNHDVICKGSVVHVNLQANGGNGIYSYHFIDGTAFNEPLTLSPSESTDYGIVLSDDCGTPEDTAYFSIEVQDAPVPSFHADVRQGCTPHSVNIIQDVSNHNQTNHYIWDFGDGSSSNTSFDASPSHTYESAGTYHVSLKITTPFGCVSEHTEHYYIQAFPEPVARFNSTPESVSMLSPNVYFENLSTNADYAAWYFGDGDSSSVLCAYHKYYPAAWEYYCTLIASNRFGCTDSLTQKVIINNELTIYIPTAFTPDNDGKNEIFKAQGHGIQEENFEMIIYDRWGEEIFKSDQLNLGWDGKVKGIDYAKPGMYTYLIKFVDYNNIPHIRSGLVNLIY